MRHEWDFSPGESLVAVRRRQAAGLASAFEGATPQVIVEQALALLGRRLAMVSSFGAESVALLHIVAEVNPHIPVLFVDTQMLFKETLDYQRTVAAELGLRDVRVVTVDPVISRLADPRDDLHKTAPDDCCHLRKTVPLDAALQGFDGWISGRKRYQTADRAAIPIFEVGSLGRMKVNPLAGWERGQAAAYIRKHGLPAHPLIVQGYKSIGCAPCTSPVAEGEDERSGRWRGSEKTECGIHFGPNGVTRTAHA